MGAIVAALLTFGLFVGPLVWCLVMDRRTERAAAIAAEIRATVRHRLGGESMVSVQVKPRGFWKPGRILLAAPSGYEELIEKVWQPVAKRVPAGYELVVRPAWSRAGAPQVDALPLPRAA